MASFEWIDADGRFRLAFRGRPAPPVARSLAQWKQEGADRVVSLQTEVESDRMGLADEEAVARSVGLEFDRFAIYDHAVPEDPRATVAFAREMLTHLSDGQAVVYHCFAGIGRSGLMAILTLVVAGYDLDDAKQRAKRARGLAVPETELQHRWLAHVAASL